MKQKDKSTVWVLVQFKPNSDGIAVRNLERQNVTVFLPKAEQSSRRNGKFVTTTKPLFPGYLFAEIDLESDGWSAINSTYGVSRIVTTGAKPSPVPEGLIEALQARCDASGLVEQNIEFDVGEEVKLSHGPFSEWVGEIVEMAPDQRAWVLLDLMGRQTRVAVNLIDLQSM
jgi:transcriptional antiterminator RfaH